jgi:ATP-dependent Clp protease ATP-binding subunit ClpX
LDKYVIGQEHAKKVIAVAIYNHYCRLRSVLKQKTTADIHSDYGGGFNNPPLINIEIKPNEEDEVVIPEKSNILLIGPSGSGKTLLAKTVSKLLKVPFAMGDATSLTEAGYVGEDVDSLLYRLLEKAKFNESVAQTGIVFLDEVDKIARAGGGVKGSTNTGGGRDVGGEGVQHALLKMLEGTVVQVVDRRKPGREFISFDTSNLLFILSGAFVGLENIVGSRSAVASIGFGKEDSGSSASDDKQSISCSSAIVGKNSSNWMDGLQTTDIISYGLIPEFIGRVPVVAVLEELDEKTLVRTLTEPRNSLIKQYQHLFKMNGVDLVFTDEALLAVGRISIESKTGARGLRGIMEKLLLPLMYDVPSKKGIFRVIIDKDFVEGKAAAKIEFDKIEESGK